MGTVNKKPVLQVLLVFRNTYSAHNNFVYSQAKLLHREQERHKAPEGLTYIRHNVIMLGNECPL